MMISIRRSDERGRADHGWLQSRHTFSFANYYDPAHMGVSCLRVINDDRVAPGKGFGAHSHTDMEIISYVKKGVLEHKDSMGHIQTLPAGEFQLMSAGSGVTHSEYNPSSTDPLEFLQIWVQPNVYGLQPGYQQQRFETEEGLTLIASADAREGSLRIKQDVLLYQLHVSADHFISMPVNSGRTLYIHVVNGDIQLNAESLHAGDGASVNGVDKIVFSSKDNGEALLFDLP